jgi:hypothetical protein
MHIKFLDDGSAVALLTIDTATGWLANGAAISTPSWLSSDPSIQVSPAEDGMSAVLTTNALLSSNVHVAAGPVVITEAEGSTITISRVLSDPLEVISWGPSGFQILKQA